MADSFDGERDAGMLFDAALALQEAERARFDVRRTAALVSFVLGSRVKVGDASQYIYHYARRQGYDIPPYPLAGCGEIKQFFAEEGVKNVPEWYAKWGIAGEDYERLHEKTLVAVSNAEGGHAVFLLDGVYYQQESGFEDLVKSGLYTALPLDVLTGLLHDIFGFLGFGEGAHGTCADGSSR